jgi:hypothetical protein
VAVVAVVFQTPVLVEELVVLEKLKLLYHLIQQVL